MARAPRKSRSSPARHCPCSPPRWPGPGSGNLVAPDTVCLFWTWGGDGTPSLTDGLSFHVDHAAVSAPSWVVSRDACEPAGVQWCADATITADDSTCQVGFVRSGSPTAQALVGMVGVLTCGEPLTDDGLRDAGAADRRRARPLPRPRPRGHRLRGRLTWPRSPGRTLPQWLSTATQIAAPITLITTLLFYFGYVYTRSQYAYFGVDVDTIGLTPRDYVMRSPQPLLVPLLVLTVLSVAAVTLRRRLGIEADEERARPGGEVRVRRVARRWVAGSATVLAAGLVLLVGYAWWGAWPYLSLVSASLIGVGAGICASALPFATNNAKGTIAGLWVLVVAAAFWAVSITADWSGRGRAQEIARNLDELPAVILDSPADLHLRNTIDPPEDLCWLTGDAPDPACAALTDQPRYRYRGLRLLVQGPSAMFLVPSTWSPSGTTLMVPRTSDARLQFQFVNTPPG